MKISSLLFRSKVVSAHYGGHVPIVPNHPHTLILRREPGFSTFATSYIAAGLWLGEQKRSVN